MCMSQRGSTPPRQMQTSTAVTAGWLNPGNMQARPKGAAMRAMSKSLGDKYVQRRRSAVFSRQIPIRSALENPITMSAS